MKTFVITVSKEFMKSHPRSGEPTNFVESILCGTKKHTLRGNYKYWKNIVDQVNSGKAALSARTWIGKPYKSKQQEFAKFYSLGIQKCLVLPQTECVVVESKDKNSNLVYDFAAFDIEKNDGLSAADFWSWFPNEIEGCIIHFTEFRY